MKAQGFYVLELGSGDAQTFRSEVEADSKLEIREKLMDLPTQEFAGGNASVYFRVDGGDWERLVSAARSESLPEKGWRNSQEFCNRVWLRRGFRAKENNIL